MALVLDELIRRSSGLQKRAADLRVELEDVAGSPARVAVLGGK